MKYSKRDGISKCWHLSKLSYVMLGALLSFTSCKKDDEITPSIYQPTELPGDITQLYKTVGNVNADTVVLYVQGGPVDELGTIDLDDIINTDPNPDHFLKVYVHQAQTFNTTIIKSGDELTFDQAIAEDEKTVQILDDVIQHFKNQSKVTYVISHSFGSFVAAHLLATKDQAADKYLVMAGRIDMPEFIWTNFRDGNVYSFDPTDGSTPVAADNVEEFGSRASTRLAAGLGKNRYSELLSTIDLEKVIYVYATLDESVGSLTKAEADFLVSRNATVLSIDGGDHSSMFVSDTSSDLLSRLKK